MSRSLLYLDLVDKGHSSIYAKVQQMLTDGHTYQPMKKAQCPIMLQVTEVAQAS